MNRYIAILLIGLAAGTSIVFSRFALAEIHPMLLLTIRMAVASGCFVLMLAIVRPNLHLGKQTWLDCILAGLLSIGLPLEISFLTLQYLSSGLFTVLLSFIGIMTMLIAHLILADEQITAVKLAGAGVAFAGVIILILTRSTGLKEAGDLRGYLFALGVVLLFSLGNVYTRRRLRQVDFSVATAIGMATSFLVSLPFTLLIDGGRELGQISGWSWSAALYSSLVGSFLYFSAIYWLIKTYGATAAGFTYFVSPVASTILGTLLLGEIITGSIVAGATLVLVGLVLVQWRKRAPVG